MTQSGTGWWLNQISRVPLLTPAQEIALGAQVQAWMDHPDGPEGAPATTRRVGTKARDRFVAANLRLAVSYVSKHCGRLVRLGYQDDLIQAANLGVIRAVEKYDPTRGYRFSTYAYWWIRQSVNRWVDQHARMISIPGSHSQLLSRIETARRRLATEQGREPSREELAADVEITVQALDELLLRARSHLSLDQAAEEDGGNLGMFVGAEDPDVGEIEERAANVSRLAELLGKLPPQQARIVRMRHGLDGRAMTPAEVATIERISTRQVERILRDSVAAMAEIRRRSSVPIAPPDRPTTVKEIVQLSLFPSPDGAPRGTRARRRDARTGR